MANFSTPTFEFADDSPVRAGRRHRRGRGYTTSMKSAANNGNNIGANSEHGGHPGAATESGNHQHPSGNSSNEFFLGQHHHPQPHYYTADWDSNANNPSNNSKNNDQDHNSCAGSLTYSASSSVQSGMSSGGESSNSSSFADIIKLIDSEGDGANEIKAFMAARSEAASEGNGKEVGAVAGWMQRVDARSKQQLQQQQKKQHSNLGRQGRRIVSSNVSLNYSKDESDDEDFQGTKLETIIG